MRLRIIIIGLIVIFVSTVFPAKADTGFMVSPSNIKADQPLAPGYSYDLPVHTIYNNTSNYLEVTVSISGRQEGGADVAPSEWFGHTPLQQRVLSESTGQFQTKVAIPDNALPGSYQAWFIFHGVPAAGKGIVNTLTLEIPFTFSVKDTSQEAKDSETPIDEQINLCIGSSVVKMGSRRVKLDTPPYIDSNSERTMVPVISASEFLGVEVRWLAENQQVKITNGDTEIILTAESTTALVNGSEKKLDCSLIIIDNRTFIPLRFVSENLGATVQWHAAEQSISIMEID